MGGQDDDPLKHAQIGVALTGNVDAALSKLRAAGLERLVSASQGADTTLVALRLKRSKAAAADDQQQQTAEDQWTEDTRAMVAALEAVPKDLAEGAFPLHSRAEADELFAEYVTSSSAASVDRVAAYFGPHIGMYVAWLQHYTNMLWLPAATGVLLAAAQYAADDVDSKFLPVQNVVMCVWTSVFLATWRRRSAALAFEWNTAGREEAEANRQLLLRTKKHSVGMRMAITVPVMLAVAAASLWTMLWFMWAMYHQAEVLGSDDTWWGEYLLLTVYSVVIMLESVLGTQLAVMLNNFEDHHTPAQSENHLIVKVVVLQAIFCYAPLFYIGFWLQDLEQLREQLAAQLITRQITGNFVEMGWPWIAAKLRQRGTKKTESGAPAEDELRRQAALDEYDESDDYLEMVIQFGYVSLFAVAFPLAPLCALVNNVLEMRVDMFKLTREVKRPKPKMRSGIGSWALVLEVMAFASLLTNCAIMGFVSSHLDDYVPALHDNNSIFARIAVVVGVEHALLLIKVVLSYAIQDVPGWVRKGLAERAERARLAAEQIHDPEIEAAVQASAKEVATRRLQEAVQASPFTLNPLTMLPLAIFPYAIVHYSLPGWFVVPVSFLYLFACWRKKERHDARLAMGIVTDNRLLQLVNGELPHWIFDSDFERVEWLNGVLTQMWASTDAAVHHLVMESVQPLLDSLRPAFITRLKIDRLSLGTVPPKITGVRIYRGRGKEVRLDVELKWRGNPDIALGVGVGGLPVPVELADLTFSGVLRVTLGPLVPRMPMFGAISVCFLKKPKIGLDLRVMKGSLMGAISSAVEYIVRYALAELYLYPRKLIVPMFEDVDMAALQAKNPVGILVVRVKQARALRKMDLIGGADPYVVLRLVDVSYRTPVISNTLKPRWTSDSEFEFFVDDLRTQTLHVNCYDEDVTGDALIGDARFQLRQVPAAGQTTSVWLKLEQPADEGGSDSWALFGNGRSDKQEVELELTWLPFGKPTTAVSLEGAASGEEGKDDDAEELEETDDDESEDEAERAAEDALNAPQGGRRAQPIKRLMHPSEPLAHCHGIMGSLQLFAIKADPAHSTRPLFVRITLLRDFVRQEGNNDAPETATPSRAGDVVVATRPLPAAQLQWPEEYIFAIGDPAADHVRIELLAKGVDTPIGAVQSSVAMLANDVRPRANKEWKLGGERVWLNAVWRGVFSAGDARESCGGQLVPPPAGASPARAARGSVASRKSFSRR